MPPILTPEFLIDTDLFHLHFEVKEGLTLAQVRARPGHCVIYLPAAYTYECRERLLWLRKVLLEALRWQAKQIITPRVESHASRGGFTYRKITYKAMRSRWGSCSSLHNLNFSLWLLLTPSWFIDYVICHELAHLSQLNHGPAFWEVLDTLLGGKGEGKRWDATINAFSRELFRKTTVR